MEDGKKNAIVGFSGGPETPEGRRPPRVSGPPENPEVLERPKRRTYSAQEKLRILADLDRCSRSGDVGALLRREGVYSSSITRWRRQRDSGVLHGLSPTKRGPKAAPPTPQDKEVALLKRENARLRKRLSQAETVIDVQKKVSQLLGIALDNGENGGKG
jgi:transposase